MRIGGHGGRLFNYDKRDYHRGYGGRKIPSACPCPTRKKRLGGNARRGWPSLLLAVDVGLFFLYGPVRPAPDPAAVPLAVHIGPFEDGPVRQAQDPAAVLLAVHIGPARRPRPPSA